MMTTVGIRELQVGLTDHVKEAESGSRLIVTRRNVPVAALMPLADAQVIGWLQIHASELLQQREPQS